MTFKSFFAASLCGAAFSLSASAQELQPNAEGQKKLTPESVLEDLTKGNKTFVVGTPSDRNILQRRDAAKGGQYPKAYILSCIDSRVPVEEVFDQGIGDVFVGRVAGNVEDVNQLGSMEYAAAVAGVKVIMVLGHEGCGAVKGACDGVELGNVTALLEEIKPAVDKVEGFDDDRSSKNKKFVDAVVEQNVKETIEGIRKDSKVLADLEKEGKLKIVGGVYSLETGEVTMLN